MPGAANRESPSRHTTIGKKLVTEATQQLSLPAPRQAGLLMRIQPDTMPGGDVADIGSGIVIRHGESVITLPAGSSAESIATLAKALNSFV